MNEKDCSEYEKTCKKLDENGWWHDCNNCRINGTKTQSDLNETK